MATNNGATETFDVGEYTRKSDGKPLLALKLWANGRATNSVMMADSPEHLISVLTAALAFAKAYKPTAKYLADVNAYVGKNAAKSTPTPTAADPMAAVLAEIQALKAENARLAADRGALLTDRPGATEAVAAGVPVHSAAGRQIANATQSRLSRIKARAK